MIRPSTFWCFRLGGSWSVPLLLPSLCRPPSKWGITEKPQNTTIKRGSTTTGPVSATLADFATSRAEQYPWTGGRPIWPYEDGCTFVIAFHSQYFPPYGRIDRGYASVVKQMRHEQKSDLQWPQQGGLHILRVFPPPGAISAAPSYNYPGRFLMSGPPSAIIWDRGAVSLQDCLTSTVSSTLQRQVQTLMREVYGDNMIAQQSSSYISRDPNEWSH